MIQATEHQYTVEKITRITMGHWQRHLPQTYAQLQAEGTLEATIRQVAEDTRALMGKWIAAGRSEFEAWQESREDYAILPAE